MFGCHTRRKNNEALAPSLRSNLLQTPGKRANEVRKMTPWELGKGVNNYPHSWKQPPKPWPQEPGDKEPKPQWAKAAQKAQKIRNEIRKLEHLIKKMEEKKCTPKE